MGFITDRVSGFTMSNGSISGANLASGAILAADFFVNVAGAWSGQVSAMAGMCLPVSPLRRFEHYFTGHRQIEPLPYIKDLDRLGFRSERQGSSGGLVNSHEPRGFNFDVDHSYFEEVVRPALARRFPTAFEGAKCHRTWSGLYEQCELDGNPIIGNWTGNHENFYVAAGFSGHGMMHAPAAGRGIAELIDKGRFETPPTRQPLSQRRGSQQISGAHFESFRAHRPRSVDLCDPKALRVIPPDTLRETAGAAR